MPDRRIPAAVIRAVALDPRLTRRQAAAAVGLATTNLLRRSKALGLPLRKQGSRWAILDLDRDELARLWAGGVTLKEIGRHFGCSIRAVTRAVTRFGLQKRRPGGGQAALTLDRFRALLAEERLAQRMAAAARRESAVFAAAGMVDRFNPRAAGVRP